MLRTTLSLLACSALLPCLLTAAPALAQDSYIRQDVVVSRVAALDLARMLTDEGIAFTQSTSNSGLPTFQLTLEGVEVWLVMYGCADNGLCKSYQLATGLTMQTKPTAAQINEWNRTKRYGKAHLDAAGNPAMSYDMDVEGGVSIGALAEHVKTYKLLLKSFLEHVGWNAK